MPGVSPCGGTMSSREHTEVAYAQVEARAIADARNPDATGWRRPTPRKGTVRVMIWVRLSGRFLEWRGSSVGRAYD
jgi:hypothetical protein